MRPMCVRRTPPALSPHLHTQALFKLSNEFRKEETRFLNRVEAQKGIKVGGTMGLVESDAQVRLQQLALGMLGV